MSIAAGGGMLHEQIAMALGVGTDTLRKYYEVELSVGAAQRRMEVLGAQFQAATKKGSTTAARVYLANEPQLAVPPPPRDAAPVVEAQEAPVAGPKLGKKEQAAADATTAQAGTEWAEILPRPGTRLQ